MNNLKAVAIAISILSSVTHNVVAAPPCDQNIYVVCYGVPGCNPVPLTGWFFCCCTQGGDCYQYSCRQVKCQLGVHPTLQCPAENGGIERVLGSVAAGYQCNVHGVCAP